MEDLHRDLVGTMILCLELVIIDSHILLYRPTRKKDFLVLATTHHAHDGPVGEGCGDSQEEQHKDIGLETTTVHDREYAFREPGNDDDEDSQMDVAERAIALCETLERRVFDGRCVCFANGVIGHDERPRKKGPRTMFVEECKMCYTSFTLRVLWVERTRKASLREMFSTLGALNFQPAHTFHFNQAILCLSLLAAHVRGPLA